VGAGGPPDEAGLEVGQCTACAQQHSFLSLNIPLLQLPIALGGGTGELEGDEMTSGAIETMSH